MNKSKVLAALCIAVNGAFLFAQQKETEQDVEALETVVISDSKFALEREKSGKVITTISQQELERSQGQSVATVLNRVAGIEINGSSSAPGQSLSYFIRGGRNRQVVIRVDGLTVSDPSFITNEFDLRLLAVDNIANIEILKGASSTLYGSGASTAVINITTKKPKDNRINANFQSTIGTNQSQEDQDYDLSEFVNSVGLNGTLHKLTYVVGFSNHFADDLSAAEKLPNDTSDATFKDDAFSRYNVNARVGYTFSEAFKLEVFGSLNEFKNQFDSGAGADAEFDSDSEQMEAGFVATYSYKNGNFVINNRYSLLERTFLADTYATLTDSRFYSYDMYNKYSIDNTFYTVVGVNGSNSDYNGFSAASRNDDFVQTINDNQADFDIIDPYANLVYTSDFGFNINVGARLNIHSEYDNQLVYSINPSYSYTFDNSYIKGLFSYSTAYITPSLFQLYSPNFGNTDLEPEENSTIESGIEFSRNNNLRLSVVYFSRKEKNFVNFVDTGGFVFQYQNVSEDFDTYGLEVEATAKLLDNKLDVSGNFTYTNLDDVQSSVRIPEIKANANIGYQLSSKAYSSLNFQYVDARDDSFFNLNTFSSEDVVLDSYMLFDWYVNYQLLENMKIFAAVTNITNEEYQELFGFGTRGRNAKIGFNLSF
ncbi:TonB-dependent receptor plug domain-containing protein [Aquimarina brevivitae]|uniref:Vitamin B12 transporter n=1 Tax=Aquimarina brevivitae TaxID=323412 RepID=A0A4Q7P2D0_9FLAO|nr:TonB-dependent receptor plug domain-containing protein [Aquimarina brevivitae]RZS93498.1 vitamin B12 transporter [Aquimarina brevivitae]